MSEVGHARLQFGAFTLDAGEKTLRHQGDLVPLTPKVFDTLEALVSHAGRLMTKDDLMKEIWPDTFVDDATLAQNISVLRKALHDSTENPRYIETVPKRGYRFVAPVTTAMDTQPSSIVAASSNAALSPSRIVPTTARPWIAAALGLTAIVAGLAYFQGLGTRATPLVQPKVMLAVLPFVNLSGDPADEYLADSLTEELTAQLGRLQPDRLGIIARTSAMSFKNSRDGVAEISTRLGVGHVIEGSVRREGPRLRVTVQLIDVRDQTHSWADNFDHTLDDLLTMQFQVARAVAEQIQTRLALPPALVRARAGTSHPLAYQLYLRAHYFWNRRNAEQGAKAVTLYQQAVDLDPTFAMAYVEMSQCYLTFASPTARDSYLKAQAAARKAITIHETLADGHIALATASLHLFDWETATQAFQRAEALNPLMRHDNYAVLFGRFDEAIAESRRSIEGDPTYFLHHHGLAVNLFYARRYDEALGHFHEALELDPTHVYSTQRLGQTYGQMARYDEAIALLKGIGHVGLASLGYVYGRSGRTMEALALAKYFLDLDGAPPAHELAYIYAGLGDKEQAFKYLNLAFDERTYNMIYVKVDPHFDGLRGDPRFAALLKRMRFPETAPPQG